MTKSQLLPAVLTNTSTLKLILIEEFDALKVQDLSAFEALQSRKADILALLTDEEVIAQLGNYSSPSSTSDSQSDGWNRVISVLEDCKELHLRNQILIDRKLESIRGALLTLQSSDRFNDVEIYDRLGKIKGRRRSNQLSHA